MKLLLLLLSLLWLTSCADQDDSVIRMGLASAPANLDPRFATDATSARINRLLYRRLVDFDEQVRPVPALADWQQLAPAHYRFRLKTGARIISRRRSANGTGCRRDLPVYSRPRECLAAPECPAPDQENRGAG